MSASSLEATSPPSERKKVEVQFNGSVRPGGLQKSGLGRRSRDKSLRHLMASTPSASNLSQASSLGSTTELPKFLNRSTTRLDAVGEKKPIKRNSLMRRTMTRTQLVRADTRRGLFASTNGTVHSQLARSNASSKNLVRKKRKQRRRKPLPELEDGEEPAIPVSSIASHAPNAPKEDIALVLSTCALFRTLEEETARELAGIIETDERCQYEMLPAGHEFEVDDSLYILVDGAVSVSHRCQPDAVPVVLSLGKQGTIGDLLLFANGAQETVTVDPESPTRALKIPIVLVHELLTNHPAVLFGLVSEVKKTYRKESALAEADMFQGAFHAASRLSIPVETSAEEESAQEMKARILTGCNWVKDASDEERNLFISKFSIKRVDYGGRVFVEGGASKALFIVLSGSLTSYTTHEGSNVQYGVYNPGDLIGEGSFVTRDLQKMTAICTSEEGCITARMSHNQFMEVLGSAPSLAWSMVSDLVGHWERSVLDLNKYGITFINCEANQAIHERDTAAEDMFMVLAGNISILDDLDASEPVLMRSVTRGGIFGGEAIFPSGVYRECAVASRDSIIARFPRTSLQAMSATFPGLIEFVTDDLIKFRDNVSRKQKGGRTCIALIPLSEHVPVHDFYCHMYDVIQEWSDCEFLTEATPSEFLSGSQQEDVEAIKSVILDHELMTDTIIMRAPSRDCAWTRAVLEMSDVIVTIGHQMVKTDISPVEQLILDMELVRIEHFVLLYPGQEPPTDLMTKFLEYRNPNMSHSVTTHDRARIESAVRLITGHGVGLVLTSDLGYSHSELGLYFALKESGIPIDIVSATGVAAVNWLLAASSKSFADCLTRAGTLYAHFHPSTKTSNTDLIAELKNVFGDMTVEGLTSSYVISLLDLVGMETVKIDTGPLWYVARCLLSLPGVTDIYSAGDEVLVPTTMLDRTPISDLAPNGAKYIIAARFDYTDSLFTFFAPDDLPGMLDTDAADEPESQPPPPVEEKKEKKKKKAFGCFGGGKKKTAPAEPAKLAPPQPQQPRYRGLLGQKNNLDQLASVTRQLMTTTGRSLNPLVDSQANVFLTMPHEDTLPPADCLHMAKAGAQSGYNYSKRALDDFGYILGLGIVSTGPNEDDDVDSSDDEPF